LERLLLTPEEESLLDPQLALAYKEQIEAIEKRLDMEEIAAGLTADLATFMRQAWNIVEPETPLQWNWHYQYLCEWLTMVSSGEFKQRYPEKLGLIINIPPRSGKSTFASVLWPTWTWLRFPSRRFLFASHTGGLSLAHNMKRRDLMKSQFFQERFANRFRVTSTGSDVIRNDHTGQFQVTSIGSGSTGFGGMILIGDDLLDREKAYSETAKKKANHWIDSSFSKMLDDRVRGVFVHISQRLAVDDPTGHILGEDGSTGKPEKWQRIKIKREAEEDETYVYPLTGYVFHRPKGDILQADRCPPYVITDLKSHSREWANQEQQEPTATTGIVFDPNWWRYYYASNPLPSLDLVVLSVDCTFKGRSDGDFVAIHKWGVTGSRRYWLNRRTERLGYVATKAAIKEELLEQRVSWSADPLPRATILLIEDSANGPAVIDELSADPVIASAVSIIPIQPEGGKDSRAYAMSTDCEAGNVYLPADAPWVGPIKLLFSQWNGEGSIPHDDDIDAADQFVNWSRNRFGWILQGAQAFASEKREVPTEPHAIAVELGTAQKIVAVRTDAAIPKVFGEEKMAGKVLTTSLMKPQVNVRTPSCPSCGNLALNIAGDYKKCVKCGWDSKQKFDESGNPVAPLTQTFAKIK
jgi:predicted phage terminase large subunit-like protein